MYVVEKDVKTLVGRESKKGCGYLKQIYEKDIKIMYFFLVSYTLLKLYKYLIIPFLFVFFFYKATIYIYFFLHCKKFCLFLFLHAHNY